MMAGYDPATAKSPQLLYRLSYIIKGTLLPVVRLRDQIPMSAARMLS